MATHDFRRVNRWQRLQTLLQVVLALTLIGGLNFLGSQSFSRMDLTDSRRYSLSPETKAFLRSIQQPVEILVVMPRIKESEESERFFEDLENLLREYRDFALRETGGNVTFEFIDVYQQRARARQVLTRHGIDAESTIVVVSGDRREVIATERLYTIEDGEVAAFNGEAEFTGAIVRVSDPRDEVVYFLTGQGELRLRDVAPGRGLSQLAQFLRERGIQADSLDLTKVSEVPPDAAAVVSPAPSSRFRTREIEILREYLSKRNGSLLAMLSPGVETGLEPLLLEWGIDAEPRIVIDTGPDFQATTGNLIVRDFGEHPITRQLRRINVAALFGLPRPISVRVGDAFDPTNLSVETLAQTSPTSWAESEFRPGQQVGYDEGPDRLGPVSVAVAAERTPPVQVELALTGGRGGKVVAFGSPDFITNGTFQAFGNRLLFINALNWALNRDDRLNIRPKPVKSHVIVASDDQVRNLLLWLLALPLAVLLSGTVVALVRR